MIDRLERQIEQTEYIDRQTDRQKETDKQTDRQKVDGHYTVVPLLKQIK